MSQQPPQEPDDSVTGDQAVKEDLPSLSIRRPVLVLVLNLLIAIAGLAAISAVEVRELPDVDRPIVSIRASFPGASPETMDAEVTRILEGAVARVSGLRSIESSSEENSARIRAEFNPGIDIDSAAADVREAVSRVSRQLPDRVEDVFVVKADDDARAIVTLSVVSASRTSDALARIIEQDIVPGLISIEGVADVQVQGARQRQLRVVADPLRLTSYGLSITDVAEALRSAPFDVPAGSFRSDDQELIVRADATATTAEQVGAIIIREPVRVADVAQVYFGPADADSFTRLDGLTVTGLGVLRQAQSNTIEIADQVRDAVARFNQQFPDIEIAITDDSSIFIRRSVSEVLTSLTLTVGIVVLVIWLFMGSWRATLVPSVTIPIALIGTVAAIWLLGFSINNLTLLALVLATGLVVDDAIVVLENIQRRRAQGIGPRAAAVLGTRQVYFAVVATTAVLIAVFVPIAFLPGSAGRLFREFGFVLAITVGISSFVALSLVPAMASRLPPATAPGNIRRSVAGLGQKLGVAYAKSLDVALRYPVALLMLAVVGAAGCAAVYKQIDQELLPPEDRGVISVWATGPDGVGIKYMERQTVQLENILRPYVKSGEARSMFTVVGFYDPNRSRVVLPLADWDLRQRSQQEIMSELRPQLAEIPGVRGRISSGNSLDLRGAGRGMEVALTGGDYQEIFAAAQALARAIEERSQNLGDTRISYQPTQPQLSIDIDRRRAASLGVDLDNLAATLRAVVDGDDLIDMNIDDQAVPIFLEAGAGDINDPGDLVSLYISTDAGTLVPLSSIVSLEERGVAAELDRHAQRRAIELDIDLPPGYPLRAAVDEVRSIANDVLPDSVSLALLGEAETLDETSRQVTLTYAIALIVVFLVLCAQFEGLISSVVVTLIVPFGLAAAILSLFLTGTSINIYSQIGLVLLIGLMAKNGILMVEFADQLRDRGRALRDAVLESSRVRFRPVMMTIVSTVLGSLPLILSTGAGSEARQAIGWVIFGGLGLATLFTLYLTPAIYVLLGRFARTRSGEAQQLQRELVHARDL